MTLRPLQWAAIKTAQAGAFWCTTRREKGGYADNRDSGQTLRRQDRRQSRPIGTPYCVALLENPIGATAEKLPDEWQSPVTDLFNTQIGDARCANRSDALQTLATRYWKRKWLRPYVFRSVPARWAQWDTVRSAPKSPSSAGRGCRGLRWWRISPGSRERTPG